MKNLICILFTVFITVFFSCSNAPKVNLNTELQALRQADNDWSEVSASKDVKRYMDFYDKDAIVIDYNGQITKDKEAVLKSITASFLIPGFSLTFHNENAVVAKAGDLGYTTGSWDNQWNNDKGELMKAHGPYLVIWKKQIDGSWKAIVDSYWKAQ
jgi:ketosteroid isomerase-like protein